jgi:hypothetical protein
VQGLESDEVPSLVEDVAAPAGCTPPDFGDGSLMNQRRSLEAHCRFLLIQVEVRCSSA